MSRICSLLLGTAAVTLSVCPVQANAERDPVLTIHLPSQPLSQSLRALAVLSGQSVLADSALIRGRQAPALDGRFTLVAGIEALVAGSDLAVVRVGDSLVVQSRTSETQSSDPIVVTGTRIRGSETASPTITLDRTAIADAGLADLGDVIRRLPQSFGGGQNPGIGMNVPEGNGIDIGGGSSANLRGLGSDATLTLLNGHRLSFSAALESVDMSAIPVSAVDHIDVVPDGASAIYGSDAVAGVVNLVLRRDFKGVETSARIAGTTDGGDFQQLYGALAGTTWSTGGLYAAYEYGDDTPIRADERSYAAHVSPGLDLFPALRHHSIIASGHQDLGAGVRVDLDMLYNIRWSDLTFPTLAGGNLDLGRAAFHSKDQSFGVAPSLTWELGGNWELSAAATYGRERVAYRTIVCSGEDCSDPETSYYRNGEFSLELGVNGPLFDLPGGAAKLAMGGGYRSTSFERFGETGSPVNGGGSQHDQFVYGELSLPLVSSAQAIPLIERLGADVALRYENYPGIDSVASPKIGVSWWLTRDVALKGNWGKSFKAPTLYQKYLPRIAYLVPPGTFGASAASLYIYGGSTDLMPERATTWSATLAFTPHAIPGMSLEASYFDVDYRDRIVQPITALAAALSNPIYANQVVLDPSPAEQAAAIAKAGFFFNYSGGPYDPNSIAALIDNGYVNAGRQRARGVDVQGKYTAALRDGARLAFLLDASYLDSTQQLSAGQAVYPLAGTIFNPPHWRGSASASWSAGGLTLSANANYTGGVSDDRATPSVAIHSLTTLDLTLRYRTSDTSPLGGSELAVSVQNLFNAKPDQIATTLPFDAPYDSTNYSPVGRLIAIEVKHTW